MEEGNIKEYTLDDVSALYIYTERSIIKFNDGRSVSSTDGTESIEFASFVEYITSAKEFVKTEYPEFTVWVLEEGCIGCDEKYSCGASGYCAPCWNERYGCEDL